MWQNILWHISYDIHDHTNILFLFADVHLSSSANRKHYICMIHPKMMIIWSYYFNISSIKYNNYNCKLKSNRFDFVNSVFTMCIISIMFMSLSKLPRRMMYQQRYMYFSVHHHHHQSLCSYHRRSSHDEISNDCRMANRLIMNI